MPKSTKKNQILPAPFNTSSAPANFTKVNRAVADGSPDHAIIQKRKKILDAIHGKKVSLSDSNQDALVLKAVGEDIDNLLHTHNLRKQSPERIEWNEEYHYWEYQVKVVTDTINPDQVAIDFVGGSYSDNLNGSHIHPDIRVQPSLADRLIKVRLLDSHSHLKQTSQDYINRANSLFNSGTDLIRKILGSKSRISSFNRMVQTKIEEIEKYRKQLVAQLKLLDPADKKQHDLAVEALQALNTKIANALQDLSATFLNSTNLFDVLKALGYIHSSIDRTSGRGMPVKAKDWFKILQAHEALFTAKIKNDIIFNVYRDPAKNDSDLWIVNKNIPFSDMPSTLRNAAGQVVPNWFRSNTKVFKINQQNQELIKIEDFSSDRSSSFSAIAVNSKDRERYTDEIVKNKLRLLVRNAILEKLYNNPNIVHNINSSNELNDFLASCFNQEILVMTLLNLPIKHKKEIRNRFLKVPEEFSETPQFFDTKRAFKKIGPIKLEDSDIRYIQDHLGNISNRSTILELLPEYLQQKSIKHHEVFHNFASSGLRWLSRENSNNKKQSKIIADWMKEYFDNKGIELKGYKIRVKFNNVKQLKQLYEYLSKEPPVDDLVLKTLSLYIKYLELLKKSFIFAEENFLRQVITALLINNLGKEIHITCKSGEDRTGAILVAIDCALASLSRVEKAQQISQNGSTIHNIRIHDAKTWKNFKKDFWQNYLRTEELSASHDITNMNAIGARGLQSQAAGIIARLIRTAVSPHSKHFEISNRMARIAKAVFNPKKYKNAKQLRKTQEKLSSLGSIEQQALDENQQRDIVFNPIITVKSKRKLSQSSAIESLPENSTNPKRPKKGF